MNAPIDALGLDEDGNVRALCKADSSPRPGEVSVTMHFVGICGTDLQMLRKERPERPMPLGHEGIGSIYRSSALANWEDRQPVGFLPVSPGSARNIGHTEPGLLQRSYGLTVEAAREHLIDIDAIEPKWCLLEPLSTVAYGWSLIESLAEGIDRVLIIGDGPIAWLWGLFSQWHGTADTVVLAKYGQRAALAADRGLLGSARAITYDSVAGELGGFDVVAVCTPRRETHSGLQLALQMARPRGVVDLVAGLDGSDNSPLAACRSNNHCGMLRNSAVPTHVRLNDRYVTGHRGSAPRHAQIAAALIREHPEVAGLITSITPIEDAPALLDELRANAAHLKGSHLKFVIAFS